MKKIQFLLLAAIMPFIISCEKTPDTTQVQLGIKVSSTEFTSLKSFSVEEFTIDSASIVIGKIELKRDDRSQESTETENENEYNFTGPYIIDLLEGTSKPGIPVSGISPGTYNKFDAEMEFIDTIGYSFVLQGNFSNVGGEIQNIPFEYTYTQSEDFKIINPDGFEISADMLNNVWVYIDLQQLLSGLDLSDAMVDRDDVIRLNNESNRDLADIIEMNLEKASELGLDDNNDGEID